MLVLSVFLAFAVFAVGMLVTNPGLRQWLSTPAVAPGSECLIISVHDGDTLRCDGEKIRISNIDAPELAGSPRCDPDNLRGGANPSWCDFELGERSGDALRALVRNGKVAIERSGEDQYGRTLGRVSVDGTDVGDYLVAQGLARPWQ